MSVTREEPEPCTGLRDGKTCDAPLFKCGHCKSEGVVTEGCTQKGCSNRKFVWVDKCVNCGRSYEKIPVKRLAAAPIVDTGASSTNDGIKFPLPNIELLFGAAIGLVAIAAAIAGLTGAFSGGLPGSSGANGGAPSGPVISTPASVPAAGGYSDICQCYRQGMALAGTGLSVLSSQYRTGFVQCRAVFGVEGGEAWTAGWTARESGKVVGAGCRSWIRGVGR